MSTKVNVTSFPLLGILGLIFVTLKLTGHITWSWLWILAPFWIPAIFVLFVLVLVAIIALGTTQHKYRRYR